MAVTVTTEVTGTHVIARYLWTKMKAELNYSESQYGGIAPFSIGGDQQELLGFPGPHVLMSWSHQPVRLWLIEREISSFTIYAQDQTDVNNFIKLGRKYLRRMDESARDVNTWVSSLGAEYGIYKNFEFKTISLRSAVGPQPPMQEGGRFDGSLVLNIEYVNLNE